VATEFDFPTSPEVGETHPLPSGQGLRFNGAGWGALARAEAVVPPEPEWGDVVLLIQGDELVDATGRHTFTQVTPSNPVASNGTALVFDGVDQGLICEGNLQDFGFAGDFTIEGFGTWIDTSANQVFIGNYNGSSTDFEIYIRPSGVLGFYASTGNFEETPSALMGVETPTHWMVCVNDGVFTLGYGGQIKVSVPATTVTSPAVNALRIGMGEPSSGTTKGHQGTSKGIRVTNGTGRYPGGVGDTYTIPTLPYAPEA